MSDVGMSDRVAGIVEGYDRLGVHRTGTSVDDAGADWFVERLAEAGVTAAEAAAREALNWTLPRAQEHGLDLEYFGVIETG